MARRGSFRRSTRWLWTSERLEARAARVLLLPAAFVWAQADSLRRLVAARTRDAAPPLPLIGLDNLTLGGSGQGTMLRWLARRVAARGEIPGLLLSPDARADVALLRRAVPSAQVGSGPSRGLVARQLAADGATILLADGVRQHNDLVPTRLLLVIAAESGRAVPWRVPAGPWREPLSAAAAADAVVVTRRRATPEAAAELVARLQAVGVRGPIGIADLGLRTLEGLVSGRRQPAESLAGRRVVACGGLGDPSGFAAQVKGTGAAVQVASWRTPDAPRDEDVAWLAHAARKADHVVVPERVGALLRDRWPAMVPEPLVALAEPTWELGEEAVLGALLATAPAAAATRPSPTPDGA